MIFWKGRGLLILVFAVLGGSAFAGLFTAISHRSSTEWNTAITLIGASIGAWISALTFCKPEQRTLLDPTTGKPVILIQSHDLYFISARSWAILSSLVAVFTIFLAIAAGPPDEIPAGASAPSGKAKSLFSNANSLIDTYKNKEVHGNNFAAEKLAQDFSTNISKLRDKTISKGGRSLASTSGGHFLTYCHVAGDGVAFMVHVPELRKFTSEAKTTIAQLAWIVASAVSAEMNPQPARIAVGIRGAILYDRAWTGIPLKDIENPEATVQYRSRDSEDAKNTMANFIDDLEKMSRTAVTATANKATAAAKSQPMPPVEPPSVDVTPKQVDQRPMPSPPDAVSNPLPTPTIAAKPLPKPSLPTDVREWKDSTGRPLRASLEKFTTPACDIAEFKREDGKVFQIPVSKFSSEDLELINKIAREVKDSATSN